MAKKVGRACSLKLGSHTVVGMGTWALNGVTSDQLDTSSFGSQWKTFELGMKDGGTISFDGLLDMADSTGQVELLENNLNNSSVTTLKLYIDSTSYFEACATTGYFSPYSTTGNDTIKSSVKIDSYSITADKSDMVKINFSGKISGCYVLV